MCPRSPRRARCWWSAASRASTLLSKRWRGAARGATHRTRETATSSGPERGEDIPMSELRYEIQEGVATITLNRPERRNAFTLEMLALWVEALRDARTNDAVHVVVVTGAG